MIRNIGQQRLLDGPEPYIHMQIHKTVQVRCKKIHFTGRTMLTSSNEFKISALIAPPKRSRISKALVPAITKYNRSNYSNCSLYTRYAKNTFDIDMMKHRCSRLISLNNNFIIIMIQRL